MILRVGAAGQCRIQQAHSVVLFKQLDFALTQKWRCVLVRGTSTPVCLIPSPAASTPKPPSGPLSHGCGVGAHVAFPSNPLRGICQVTRTAGVSQALAGIMGLGGAVGQPPGSPQAAELGPSGPHLEFKARAA